MGDLINVTTYRYKGGFGVVTDQASVDLNGRQEGFVSLGEIQTAEEAERLARSIMQYTAHDKVTHTVAVEPRSWRDAAYSGWNLGDTVTLQNGLVVTPERIVGITITETDLGDPIAVPELGSPEVVDEERNQRLVSRMLAGGLGGMSSSVSQIGRTDAQFDPGEIASAETPTFSIPGEVEVGISPPHIFDEPTRLVGWGLGAETWGLATTRIEYLVNGEMLTNLDYLELLANQRVALTLLYGQALVLGPGDWLQIRVTVPGAHEDVTAKFVGVQSI